MPDVRSHNEGSIYPRPVKRKAQSYIVFTAAVSLPDGRRRTAACPHHHKPTDRECREARELLDQLRVHRDAGSGDPRRTRLGPFLERWVNSVQGLAPLTMRQHRMIVTNHLSKAPMARKTLAELRPSDVDEYLARGDLDPQTLRHHRATLRRALADAQREGLVMRNVAALAHAPRLGPKERKTLSAQQVRRLLDGTRGDRLHALWAIGATCGLRLSEALGLAWSDLEGDTLHIRAQLGRDANGWCRVPLKTAKSRRSIPLPAVTRNALNEHKAIQDAERGEHPEPIDGYMFLTRDGKNVHGTNVLPPFYRALSRLDLPRVTYHALRHTTATVLLAEGVPLPVISAILGHSSIRITADIYAHVLNESKVVASEAMERAVGG